VFSSLTTLNCSNNTISTLSVTANTVLQNLICNNNSLSSLNVSANTALIQLNCSNNNLNSLNVKNGNNTNFTLFDARQNTNLSCVNVDSETYSTTNWTNKDATTSFSENCATVGVNQAFENKSLTFFPNPTNGIIHFATETNFTTFAVMDILGSEVLSGNINQNKIDISDLKNGIYQIELRNNTSKSKQQKIIKF
jgi:hypothetical protein